MTTATLYTLTRDILNTDSTVLPDSKLLEWINIAYGHRILDILRFQVDRNASLQSSKTDFVSTTGLIEGNNGYNGEYSFPSELLRPIRVEVTYDGTNWVKCSIYDLNENEDSEADETALNNTFSESEPYVNFERNSFFIRPLNAGATVTNGIRFWYEKRQAALTAGDSPDFEENLHDVLAFDLAEMELIRHAEKYPSEIASRIRKEKLAREDRFKWFYNDRMKRNFQAKPSLFDAS